MSVNAESMIRFLLIGICLVATITGLNIIVLGIGGIPNPDLLVQASVDNELRFMSVFWVAFGIYCFGLSRNVSENLRSVVNVAIIFFCSGLARLLSFILVGEPITLFIGVMILEFVLPMVLWVLVWMANRNAEGLEQV